MNSSFYTLDFDSYGAMKTRALVLSLVLVVSPVFACPESKAESPAPSSILVKAGKLLDVRKASYIENAAIWIQGERIKEIGPVSQVQAHAPKNAEIVDLSRATVLPGLIDCHTHLMARVADLLAPESYLLNLATKSHAFRALEGAADARVTLNAGFTSVRDVENEGSGYADVALRDAIKQGLRGPGGRRWRIYGPKSGNW